MKTNFIILLVMMLATSLSYSQVGIGTDNPEKHTILDIVSQDMGILIPRLTEIQRNSIPTNEASDGLVIYNTTEDCFNYWNKMESIWSSICGKAGKAIFTVDCGNIQTNGSYLNKVTLNSNNSLLVTVTVTKEGSYTISAMTDPNNGYFFTRSGDFLSTGIYTIEIPGYGTPTTPSPEGSLGDKFTLSLNGVVGDTPCNFYIPVQDSSVKPEFTMDCSSTIVKGIYQKDKLLDATNYIDVTIRFDASKNGAPLHIYTNTVDGITFDSGNIKLDSKGQASGWVTQTIQLLGSGVTSGYNSKLITIYSNSSISSSTCQTSVFVGYDSMKIRTSGAGVYDAAGTGRLYTLLHDELNYGLLEGSIIKFKGYDSFSNIADNPTADQLTTELLGDTPPDIFITGQTGDITANTAEIYKQYLDKGGVMLVFQEDPTRVNRFWTGLYPSNTISTDYSVGVGAAGAVYQLANIDDPVLNGPFGDIRGEYWGEDASNTASIISGVPKNDLIIYSTDPSGRITALRHKKWNLIWVGDGGFNSSTSRTANDPTNSTAMPFWLDALTINGNTYPNYPVPKPGFGNSTVGTRSYSVYNSVFTANAMAWALEMAQTKGINPH